MCVQLLAIKFTLVYLSAFEVHFLVVARARAALATCPISLASTLALPFASALQRSWRLLASHRPFGGLLARAPATASCPSGRSCYAQLVLLLVVHY